LAPLPIDIGVPIDGHAFMHLFESFCRRDLWDMQPAGLETGWEGVTDHFDIQLNLWGLFGGLSARHGGAHSGRVGLVLSETSAVEPDQYYFKKSRRECLLADDYYQGVPDLIAEIMSPATRPIDRGPRKELYRRHGVKHLWLLDPEIETLEVYELDGSDYRLVQTLGRKDAFQPALFPGERVAVGPLFLTQWKRHLLACPSAELYSGPKIEPVPEWLVSPETQLGLEYLFLVGHPDRRFEIWNNRAPCVLPFGSVGEARVRFAHFVQDACRWEQMPVPQPSVLADDVEQAEVGRFRLTRKGRPVHLDVAVDGRRYRRLMETWTRREAWDWGEK
jgi:Uma2 family endonuclease